MQRSDSRNRESTLGGLVKALRQRNGWTLKQMSPRVGIPLSTLAKVEANVLSLNYDKLQQLTSRLGLTMAEFMSGEAAPTAPAEAPPPAEPPRGGASAPATVMARRSLTESGNSVLIETPNYLYEYLCSDLRDKRMVPILARIRAKSIEEFGELLSHQGEEFVMVIEGTIEVHSQFYTPMRVEQGKGVYIDSSMGHAYVAKDCDSALVLAVCSGEDEALQSTLMKLAEAEGQTKPAPARRKTRVK
jgi:transcriptional regulator with XRE-family HTH domain